MWEFLIEAILASLPPKWQFGCLGLGLLGLACFAALMWAAS